MFQKYLPLILIFISASTVVADAPKRLPYNNPGLTVDLGVGLWAWPLPMDWDKDGDIDLLVSCPDVPSSGIYFFENPGGSKLPVFKPGVRVGQGRNNIRVSYVDGAPRVMTPGLEWTNFLGGKFKETQEHYRHKIPVGPGRIRADQRQIVDFDGDGILDLVVGIEYWGDYGWDNAYDENGNWKQGPLHGYVFFVRNKGSNEKPDYEEPVQVLAEGSPVDVYGMPGPCIADFDSDGDLDLLCGEFVDSFTYFENQGSRTVPKFAAGKKLMHNGKTLRMDLCMIVPTPIDWDQDGDIDLVVGQEDGRVALLENLGQFDNSVPSFAAPQFFQQEAKDVKFGALVTPVGFDWDNDGDQDIVAGNSAGYIGLIENLGIREGNEMPTWAPPVELKSQGEVIRIQTGPNGSIQGPCESKWGYTTLNVADWDHDGLPDLVVNSIWGKVIWYKNIGTREKPVLAGPQSVEVAWSGTPPKPKWNWWNPEPGELVTQWRTTPVVGDWNNDGLHDLITLDTEGYLVLFERQKTAKGLQLLPGQRVLYGQLLGAENSGNGAMRLNPLEAGKSGRRKLSLVDWDGDGQRDLLINSVNTNLLKNVSVEGPRSKFQDLGPISDTQLAGHTTSPTTVDWNQDGKPDLLVGAEDGFLYYWPHQDWPRSSSQ